MTERERFEAWYGRSLAHFWNNSDAAFAAWCAAIAAERARIVGLLDGADFGASVLAKIQSGEAK